MNKPCRKRQGERYAACDDEGDIAQYPGMDAFFNLK